MSDNRNYLVYVHTNTVNGKRYVGITRQRLTKRWQNGGGYDNCPHFARAIKKYGWNSFTHEVYKKGLTEEEAKELEKALIAEWKTTMPEFGYNATLGGDGVTKYASPEESEKAYKEQTRQWNRTHKDKCHEWGKRYREQHPNYNKEYYAAHKEEYHHRYLAETEEKRESRRQYTRQYRKENPEKVKETHRRYREAHREKYKAYMKAYHQRKKEEALLCLQ